FCAASAIGPTGNPTTPNMYWTPCSFRLFASKSAPLISAISLSCQLLSPLGGGRRPMGDARSAPMIEECLAAQITYLLTPGKWACPAAKAGYRDLPRPTGTLVTLPRHNSTGGAVAI